MQLEGPKGTYGGQLGTSMQGCWQAAVKDANCPTRFSAQGTVYLLGLTRVRYTYYAFK